MTTIIRVNRGAIWLPQILWLDGNEKKLVCPELHNLGPKKLDLSKLKKYRIDDLAQENGVDPKDLLNDGIAALDAFKVFEFLKMHGLLSRCLSFNDGLAIERRIEPKIYNEIIDCPLYLWRSAFFEKSLFMDQADFKVPFIFFTNKSNEFSYESHTLSNNWIWMYPKSIRTSIWFNLKMAFKNTVNDKKP